MVYREQVGQPGGIVLGQLQGVDHLSQPVDERHAAPGQADEHGADVAAQRRLVARQPNGFPVHLVKGAGDLADLVGGVDVDGFYAGRDAVPAGRR